MKLLSSLKKKKSQKLAVVVLEESRCPIGLPFECRFFLSMTLYVQDSLRADHHIPRPGTSSSEQTKYGLGLAQHKTKDFCKRKFMGES